MKTEWYCVLDFVAPHILMIIVILCREITSLQHIVESIDKNHSLFHFPLQTHLGCVWFFSKAMVKNWSSFMGDNSQIWWFLHLYTQMSLLYLGASDSGNKKGYLSKCLRATYTHFGGAFSLMNGPQHFSFLLLPC